MPTYNYRCPEGHEFDKLQKIADRATAQCSCGKEAVHLVSAPRIDPNMDTPGAKMLWRKKAELRGRGTDMTSANRTVQDEGILRDAHKARAARGENPVTI